MEEASCFSGAATDIQCDPEEDVFLLCASLSLLVICIHNKSQLLDHLQQLFLPSEWLANK